MPSFTFLHAADLHLDSPLRGLDTDAPAGRIRDATRQALVNLVRLALERRVTFVLLAGDLYDGNWKDWRTGQFLVQQLAHLTRAGIEIVAISGNHDAEQVLTKKLSVPGMMRANQPETRRLTGAPVAVHGQSFATQAVTDNIALGYPERVEGLFNIGLLHTACGSGKHENYAPCSVADLTRHGYDYWALGHVHTHGVLSREPWIVFPGNTQGRHINEEGAKGAILVTVDGGRVSIEHQALDVLRWRCLDVNVTGAAGLEAVLTRIRHELDLAVLIAEERMLVARITLVGECPMHAVLTRSAEATLQEVRAAAAEVAGPDELWVEDVRVATRPALDLAELRARPGALGALVQSIEQPMAVAPSLLAFVRDQLRRTDGMLDENHPAHAIAKGHVPEHLVESARALLLAELARR